MISDITHPLERFIAFVYERECIRKRRENGPPPWTEEPILQHYRFTNIHREDDKVSKHYQKTIRARYGETDLVFPGTVLYRWFNRPETCDMLFNQPDFNYQSTFERYVQLGELDILLHRLRMTSVPHVTGAYIITGMRGHPKGEGVMRWFHIWCEKPWRDMWVAWKSHPPLLQEIYEQIQSIGLGSFMRAQLIADLKYLPFLKNAQDWWTFAAPGPGSLRGLNVLTGNDMNARWNEQEWLEQLTVLNNIVTPSLEKVGISKLHNQDLQNCLCEFSKFEKTRMGKGRPRQVFRSGAC